MVIFPFMVIIKYVNKLKNLGLPYDEIISDVVNKSDVHTFSIPKLKVYESQTEPFFTYRY